MSSASARKEMRELQAILRKKGYKLAPSKSGHVTVLDKRGGKVIDDHGPVFFSSTPSDFRARDLAAARLIRAGIPTADDLPWKPQQAKDGEDGERQGILLGKKEEEREQAKASQRAASRNAHERTQQVRGRIEPLLAALGGWTKRGMVAELADTVFYYNKDTPWGFKTKQAARTNTTNLRKGGTLSDESAQCWEALLNDLEQAPRMQDRWFDLVRESRGLPAKKRPVVMTPAATIVDPAEAEPVVLPRTGYLNQQMQSEYGNGDGRERYGDHEHPVLEMHRNGGLRWPVEFTIDDLNELNRAVGFFEGLAVQLAFFDGQELVEPALEKVRRIVEMAGEARHNAIVQREGGIWQEP